MGSNVLGRTTLREGAPSGFGRMLNVRIDRPRTWLGEPARGFRDLFAGRPRWTARPSDVDIREAFRAGGEKPNLGQVIPQNRLRLPASVPLREGEHTGDWQFGVPNEPQVTPRPRVFAALPAESGGGEVQPMVWERAPSHPGACIGIRSGTSASVRLCPDRRGPLGKRRCDA